ncbi:acylase [Flavobacteriaceae bacterium]|nr:acylase [Flavobacteriaceae bacterium]MDB4560198.1 acylase [Flavobacteriaceae bacterium]MDC1167896.1 acylase [Flavobacteriaceae bacterium]
MKKIVFLLFAISIYFKGYSQINPDHIEIIRDNYGVPHIYAATDPEVAYGFAWAQAEDHFKLIQEGYLAGNGLLGKLIGLKGAGADFLTQLIQSEETVDKYYNTLDKKFIALAEGFAAGLNAYAKKYPEQILEKKLFPLTVKKLLRYTQLQLFISNEADKLVSGIVNNSLSWPYKIEEDSKGSNFIAISRNRTGSDETFLAINTHQPLEGPTSWYEAHLVSEEGTNIIGAAFPGTPCILTGANEYLGWTHTVNYPDKADVFALQMHPKKKDVYLVDGKPYKLEKFKAKLTVKFLGINIPIKKKFYKSIYGPTLKNKTGVYSVRTPSTTNITAIEQWWKMNKATNFSEFYEALEMRALPGYNVGYADRNDTIFYISNGKIPIRAKGYDWTDVVPGNTSETLWNTYYDIKDLPQVVKPKSGFVYNANHSPFKSSSAADNPIAENFAKEMNFETYDNNRSTRLLQLLEEEERIDYKRFKRIKYDHQLPTPLQYNYMDLNPLFDMKVADYPEVSTLLTDIHNWDRITNPTSYGAGAYASLYYQLTPFYYKLGKDRVFTKEALYEALKITKAHLKTYFNAERIQLGEFQKLVRGNKELPIYGLPDVVTAMKGQPYKDGKIKITHGESYIGLVRFTPNKTYFESVISFGNSRRPESPHYTDQMELYSNFETKTMSFDRSDVMKTAKKVYAPK